MIPTRWSIAKGLREAKNIVRRTLIIDPTDLTTDQFVDLDTYVNIFISEMKKKKYLPELKLPRRRADLVEWVNDNFYQGFRHEYPGRQRTKGNAKKHILQALKSKSYFFGRQVDQREAGHPLVPF